MPLPPGFTFGVATAGFQVEGGYNGSGQPANNWAAWEAGARVERSGIALDFWHRFEEQLDRVAGLGCDAVRLSVEWARVEPAEGEVDAAALDRYAAILDACHDRRLQPLVTLNHFTHPAWLGEDFWLRPDSPERFVEWVDTAVERLAGRCRHWLTINEPNVLALQSYLLGGFPPGRRRDVAATVRTLDHLLTAHVLAYDVIKQRQPQATVGLNTYALSLYELEALLTDVLLARSRGIGRYELRPYLLDRRRAEYAALNPVRSGERALRRLSATAIPLEQALPRAVGTVFASPHERCLDVLQIDFYDPSARRHFRMPGHRTAGGRGWTPARALWDDAVDPVGLTQLLLRRAEPGVDLWVVENGLCNRVRDGVAYPRRDGWDRPRHLRAHLAAVQVAVERGAPVTAYYHWTLADNYEWGSYEPRFGIFGVERNGEPRWSDHDSMGDDAAGTYRALIGTARGVAPTQTS